MLNCIDHDHDNLTAMWRCHLWNSTVILGILGKLNKAIETPHLSLYQKQGTSWHKGSSHLFGTSSSHLTSDQHPKQSTVGRHSLKLFIWISSWREGLPNSWSLATVLHRRKACSWTVETSLVNITTVQPTAAGVLPQEMKGKIGWISLPTNYHLGSGWMRSLSNI